MTVPKWNPEKFHRQHTTPQRSPYRLRIIAASLALVMAGAVAVTASADEDMVGVCHATGDGYVHLVVADDGFEHGHHRHHEADFFTDAGDCDGDAWPQYDEADANVTEPETTPGPADETAEEPADETAEEADETAEANETMEGPAETEDSTDANETAGDETVNETAEPAPGDAYVRQSADQSGDRVVLTISYGNAGEGIAADAMLHDSLPDVGRTWAVSGADCILDGNDLTCWLGDLEPGSQGAIQLTAYTDQMRCGNALTNTVHISAVDDPEGRNDASSASIHANPC